MRPDAVRSLIPVTCTCCEPDIYFELTIYQIKFLILKSNNDCFFNNSDSGNNPKTSANVLEKPIGKKLSKPETKEAPAPQRDRIIGGIGGGGFISGKEQGGTILISQLKEWI